MVDHHVDRPEVEREQSPQLTGTNRSIGLRAQAGQPARTTARVQRQTPGFRRAGARARRKTLLLPHIVLGLVATARGQTPDPIPNSAVKTLSAHGTAAQAAGE